MKNKLRKKLNRLYLSYKVIICLTIVNIIAIVANSYADYYRDLYYNDYVECARRADYEAGGSSGFHLKDLPSGSDAQWQAAFNVCMKIKGWDLSKGQAGYEM